MEQSLQENKKPGKTRRRYRILLWILIPILILGASFLISLSYLIDPNIYREQIQKSLAAALGREVTVGRAKINLWGGLGIAFDDIRVKDRSQAFDLLRSKRLILRIKYFPLLKKKAELKRIILIRPVLRLIRNKNGRWNVLPDSPLNDETLNESRKKILEAFRSSFGCSFAIRDGEVLITDESAGPSPLRTEVRSLRLKVSDVGYREAFPFRLSGKIVQYKKEGAFYISGKLQNILEDLDLSKGRIEAELVIKGVETSHFWPYFKGILPMKAMAGSLDLEGHYQGDFQGLFKTSAKIRFKEFLLDYPQVFAYILNPKWLNIEAEAQYDGKDFKVPRLFIELPQIWAKVKGRIYDIGSKEMGMEAEASTSPFDIAEGKKLIPFRVIVPDISDRLFRSEGKGSFQAVSIKLSGKMPEVDHCDELVNAHVLTIEAKLDGAQLKLPWNFPPLEDLSGQLLFQNGNLYLKGVKGRIFHSPLEKISGTFFELLQASTLQLECQGTLDLMDLPSLAKSEGIPEDFSRGLSAIQILSGKAPFSLSATGLLKAPIHLRHQGIYHFLNARFTHPKIPFPVRISEGQVELSHHDLQWSNTRVEFGQSSLVTNGSWGHGEEGNPLKVTGEGSIALQNLFALFRTPLFPEEVRSKINSFESLSGISRISFKGRRPAKVPQFSCEGEFSQVEATLLQKGASTPLVLKGSGISFSDTGIVFSKMKIQSGRSSLTLDGAIGGGDVNLFTQGSVDLKQVFLLMKSPLLPGPVRSQMEEINEVNGDAEIHLFWSGKTAEWIHALKEGEIRLKRVNLHLREMPVSFSRIEGTLSITPELVRFDALKGKVGDSPFTVTGAVSHGSSSSLSSSGERDPRLIKPEKRISFQIYSPQLDFNLLFPKREKASGGSLIKIRDWLSNWSVDGRVRIDKGKFRSLNYQDLNGEIKTIDGALVIRPLQFKEDGGEFQGEGWIKPTEKGLRMEVKPRFSHMEAKAFIRALFQKEEEDEVAITGRVTLDQMELRGEGENLRGMIGSLNGGLKLRIEDGVIERFNILSKIFSILNVSQLVKGNLPDLKTKGFPYRQITATIDVKEGIASTEDFLVDSDSMRITLLGKVDLSKNSIDARIGVHPLITIDKILSNVPIVGYIITGPDKAFLSYFYEVKGNLNDPKIEAIPLKSLSEPTWGIMKRLLETPLRPFQKPPASKQ